MSKCPFWSNAKENISCYNTCPMYSEEKAGETCPFRELTGTDEKNSLGNTIDNEVIYYSQDRYANYEEEDKVINY